MSDPIIIISDNSDIELSGGIYGFYATICDAGRDFRGWGEPATSGKYESIFEYIARFAIIIPLYPVESPAQSRERELRISPTLSDRI